MSEDRRQIIAQILNALAARDHDAAEALVMRARESGQHDSEIHRLWARVHYGRGDARAAIGVLSDYVAAQPDDLAALKDLATLQEWGDQSFDALRTYRQIVALEPANGYIREVFSQGLQDQALQALSGRKIGREASKTYAARLYSGFIQRYLSGARILDIGYRGGFGAAVPIVPQAIGVDLDYPGYDGSRLPFEDESQDAVFSSHCLEHIERPAESLRDWFRVLRVGGYLVIAVPHQFLYERRRALPSMHPDHKQFFSPASLMALVETALEPNHYRLRLLQDNDLFYDYTIPPEQHPVGCYEIEMVLERIRPPAWNLT